MAMAIKRTIVASPLGPQPPKYRTENTIPVIIFGSQISGILDPDILLKLDAYRRCMESDLWSPWRRCSRQAFHFSSTRPVHHGPRPKRLGGDRWARLR